MLALTQVGAVEGEEVRMLDPARKKTSVATALVRRCSSTFRRFWWVSCLLGIARRRRRGHHRMAPPPSVASLIPQSRWLHSESAAPRALQWHHHHWQHLGQCCGVASLTKTKGTRCSTVAESWQPCSHKKIGTWNWNKSLGCYFITWTFHK